MEVSFRDRVTTHVQELSCCYLTLLVDHLPDLTMMGMPPSCDAYIAHRLARIEIAVWYVHTLLRRSQPPLLEMPQSIRVATAVSY